ncbi:Protein of unknown function DUF3468 [Phaffia rhodozyma]|uniref:Uncharacterized protein n=1 Tax=Phaffia rhodozyma TaxID=264483 RepID=A0A0F7SQM3_PHARH|nr:Protein of unknown function DUF3468 [Phaffia rhodozyma]
MECVWPVITSRLTASQAWVKVVPEGGNGGSGSGSLTEESPECSALTVVSPEKQHPLIERLHGRDGAWDEQNKGAERDRDEDGHMLLIAPTSELELNYPDSNERFLLRHALNAVKSWPSFMAITPDPKVGKFSPIELCMPFLDIQHFLSIPRGSSTATDAVSLSLLSIAAVHLSYLHHVSSVEALLNQDSSGGQISLAETERYANMGDALVTGSLALAESFMNIQQIKGLSSISGTGSKIDAETGMDMLLAACLNNILSRCLAGGNGGREFLNLAGRIIRMRGGPKNMLDAAIKIRGGTRKSFRRKKALIESIWSWELCSSISAGRVPDSYSDTLQSWIFNPEPGPINGMEMDEGEWDILECIMGLSRSLLELLSRVNSLYAHSHPLTSIPGKPIQRPVEIDLFWKIQAWKLLVELDIRAKDISHQFGHKRPQDSDMGRLELGNIIWIRTTEMILKMDLLAVHPSDPETLFRARDIIDLVNYCHSKKFVMLLLLWPIIVAGSVFQETKDRDQALTALRSLRSVCCFDLDSGFAIIHQVWDARDNGNEWASWRDVAIGSGDGFIIG